MEEQANLASRPRTHGDRGEAEDEPTFLPRHVPSTASEEAAALVSPFEQHHLLLQLEDDCIGASLRQEGTNRRALTNHQVWGWLEPCCPSLPMVRLAGPGVALGRGIDPSDSLLMRLRGSWTGTLSDFEHKLKRAQEEGLTLEEVPDGRVSRLHCLIRRQGEGADLSVVVEDCSRNGTFIHGHQRLGPGQCCHLQEGDKLGLVVSPSPLVELCFTFRAAAGSREEAGEGASGGSSGDSISWGSSGLLTPIQRMGSRSIPRRALARCLTVSYTSTKSCNLEDMTCPICQDVFTQCVALEPCGHSFCAPCLSHLLVTHIMEGRLPLCAFRCTTVKRVVVNPLMRSLVERHWATQQLACGGPPGGSNEGPGGGSPLGLPLASAASPEELCRQGAPPASGASPGPHTEGTREAGEEGAWHAMHPLCPLNDEHLPLDVEALMSVRLQIALKPLLDPGRSPEDLQVALKALAHLAWQDENVRSDIVAQGVVPRLMSIVAQYSTEGPGSMGVQIAAWSLVAALIRGQEQVSRNNSRMLVEGGVLKRLQVCMRLYRQIPEHQAFLLMLLRHLVWRLPAVQVMTSKVLLGDVLEAMKQYPDNRDIHVKALQVLISLTQGNCSEVPEVRTRLLRRDVLLQLVHTLSSFGMSDDDVLWGGLTLLSDLTDQGHNQWAVRRVSEAGLAAVVERAYRTFWQRTPADDDADQVTELFIDQIRKAGERRLPSWTSSWVAAGLVLVAPVLFWLAKRSPSGPSPSRTSTLQPLRS